MPEGYEWPVWPNTGELVQVGDWYTVYGEGKRQVESIFFNKNKHFFVDSVGEYMFKEHCEYIPTPPYTERLHMELDGYCKDCNLTHEQADRLHEIFNKIDSAELA